MNLNSLEKGIKDIKYYICKMCLIAESGHPSSSLSCADIIECSLFKNHGFKK